MPSNRFERRRPLRERRKVFVIATEGKETEKAYFQVFNGDRFRRNVHVKVLPTPKGRSSPGAVMRRLQEYVRDFGVESEELWIVIDVDSWGEQMLDDLCHRCAEHGYNVAVSNPCFEFWLVLHQEKPPTPTTARACEEALARRLGSYHKAKYDVEKLVKHVRLAIKHARYLDTEPDESWPHDRGTRVYKLVEKLLPDEQ